MIHNKNERDKNERATVTADGEKTGLLLKGEHFGVRVVFPEDLSDDALLKIFAAVPNEAYVLPIGDGVVLDFQGRPCSEKFIARVLREVVWPGKLKVLAWLSGDVESAARLDRAGFRVAEPEYEPSSSETGWGRRTGAPKNFIIDRSLRSGNREEYAGDVVLAGHLNDGAEVFAGGSVYVLGRLKGLVHAGCAGTEGVCVVAASFEARQIRIGDKLCDQFGDGMKWRKKPVIITLEDEGLLFREWTFQ